MEIGNFKDLEFFSKLEFEVRKLVDTHQVLSFIITRRQVRFFVHSLGLIIPKRKDKMKGYPVHLTHNGGLGTRPERKAVQRVLQILRSRSHTARPS